MKITLDIDKLLQEKQISPEEYARLKALAASDTGSLAFNILIGFGVVAVGGGLVAWVQSAAVAAMLGLALAAGGAALSRQRREQWGLLGVIFLIVGSLTAAGSIIGLTEGSPSGFLAVALLCLTGAICAKSGLLAAATPCAILSIIGGMTDYSHATYTLAIYQPLLTIVLFSLLSVGAHVLSQRLSSAYERLAVIFARTSLVIANFGFWIGSLWGDPLTFIYAPANSQFAATSHAVPDWAFVVGWALALIATGVWATMLNRRYVVNTVATFAAIHFYTQLFERLGASPGVVVIAGLLAIAIAFAIFEYNRQAKSAAIASAAESP